MSRRAVIIAAAVAVAIAVAAVVAVASGGSKKSAGTSTTVTSETSTSIVSTTARRPATTGPSTTLAPVATTVAAADVHATSPPPTAPPATSRATVPPPQTVPLVTVPGFVAPTVDYARPAGCQKIGAATYRGRATVRLNGGSSWTLLSPDATVSGNVVTMTQTISSADGSAVVMGFNTLVIGSTDGQTHQQKTLMFPTVTVACPS